MPSTLVADVRKCVFHDALIRAAELGDLDKVSALCKQMHVTQTSGVTISSSHPSLCIDESSTPLLRNTQDSKRRTSSAAPPFVFRTGLWRHLLNRCGRRATVASNDKIASMQTISSSSTHHDSTCGSRSCGTPRRPMFPIDDQTWIEALCQATYRGHEAIVNELLSTLVRVSSTQHFEVGHSSPGSIAASTCSSAVARIVAKGSNWNYVPGDRYTTCSSVLHQAAWLGYTGIVSSLLAHGANVDQRDSNGETALHQAARLGRDDVVATLLPLVAVAASSELNSSCTDFGVDHPALNGETPLHQAAHRSHDVIVETLLAFGSDVNRPDGSGETALHKAAKAGYAASSTVQVLLTHGADVHLVDRLGFTALHHAARLARDHSVVRTLLDHGADVNHCYQNPNSPLHLACRRACETVVLTLLAYGANVHYCSCQDGETAMHKAARNGLAAILSILLAHGAGVGPTSNTGWSPLHCAAAGGHVACFDLLLANGAALNQVTTEGYGHNTTAYYRKCHRVVTTTSPLLRSAARVMRPVPATPLQLAARGKHFDFLEYIISQYADILDVSCNEQGMSLIEIADIQGNSTLRITALFLLVRSHPTAPRRYVC
jgi:ankyrin repeat protein